MQRHVDNAHDKEESSMDEVETRVNAFDAGHSYPKLKRRRLNDPESEDDESGSEDDESGSEDDDTSESEDDETSGSEDNESGVQVEEISGSEDDETSDEDGASSDLEDNAAYQDWLQEATEVTEAMRSDKYDKYAFEGMNEDQAKEKAKRKTLWAVKRIFFNKYMDFLTSYLHLQDNDTHQNIVEDFERKVGKGMEIDKALNRVLPKHQSKFDGLFQQDEKEDHYEDSDD